MRRLILTTAIAIGLLAAAAPAQAAGCEQRQVKRAFLRFADPIEYFLAPNGGFEQGATGWTLRGGAEIVKGNEPFYLNASGDGRSLLLPGGSSATTAPVCLEKLSLTMRYTARNHGTVLLSSLFVEALVYERSGKLASTLPAGVHTGLSSWGPSLPALVLLNAVAPLNPDGTIRVAFRFTPIGLGAKWQIDDVFVDPLKHG